MLLVPITAFVVPIGAILFLLCACIGIIWVAGVICFVFLLWPVWFPFPFLWALLNNDKEFLEPLTLPGLGVWFLHLLEAYLKFCLAYVNQLAIPYRFATTFLVHGLKKASEDWP